MMRKAAHRKLAGTVAHGQSSVHPPIVRNLASRGTLDQVGTSPFRPVNSFEVLGSPQMNSPVGKVMYPLDRVYPWTPSCARSVGVHLIVRARLCPPASGGLPSSSFPPFFMPW